MKILIDGQTLSTPDIHRGIGEVFLQVLINMINLGKEHDFFLAVYGDYKKNIISDIFDKIQLIDLGNQIDVSESGSEEYSRTIIHHISEKNIDCFWIPNPVMPNVNFIKTPLECRVIVTFYDLIPYIFKRQYLNAWQNDVKNEYLKRLRNLKVLADFILPISNSTKNDLTRQLKISPTKMKTLYPGLKRFTSENPEIGQNCSDEKYILYVGGFDPRKNMERSVYAFKQLVDTYHHNDLKYIIVCSCDQKTKEKFLNFVQAQGLSGKVELTGHVSDFELGALYRNADVLFFPSLYEGFGLPVAEAMAAGIPVAVSNRSSLPELVDNAGLLFDPENIDDMAEKLHRILTDPDLRKFLISRGIYISHKYSWETLAEQYLEILKSSPPAAIRDTNFIAPTKKKSFKIAYFSPVHPQISGISQYSKELLLALQKYADIDLFLDTGIVPDDLEIKQNFRYFCYTVFDKKVRTENYDGIIYHIGNNPFHEYIYKISLRYPGIIVLHDYVIYPFLRHVTLDRGKLLSYLTEIYNIEPPQKRANLVRQILKKGLNSVDVFKYPLNDRVIKAGKTVIVHSQYVRKLLKGYPHVYVIPHGRYFVDYSKTDILENKKSLQLMEKDLIISVFGFLNWNKRIDVVVRVFKRLQITFPDTRLLLIGAINTDIKEIIKEKSERFNIIGYVNEDTYYKYLSVSDIIINLRSPTMGETSGTLLDAMGFGKPVIVSNIGSYRETPDNCCWKVDLDEYEEELLYEYLRELILNPKLREIMGKNGKEFIQLHHNWEKIALKYIQLIKSK